MPADYNSIAEQGDKTESQLWVVPLCHRADIIMQKHQRQTPCQALWSDSADLAAAEEVEENERVGVWMDSLALPHWTD